MCKLVYLQATRISLLQKNPSFSSYNCYIDEDDTCCSPHTEQTQLLTVTAVPIPSESPPTVSPFTFLSRSLLREVQFSQQLANFTFKFTFRYFHDKINCFFFGLPVKPFRYFPKAGKVEPLGLAGGRHGSSVQLEVYQNLL